MNDTDLIRRGDADAVLREALSPITSLYQLIRSKLQALPAVQPAAVRVKPLVWLFYHANHETGFLPHEIAKGIGGSYLIEYCRDRGGWRYDLWMPEQVAGKRFDTLEAAKAAAQADYEARIRAALEPQPAPAPDRWRPGAGGGGLSSW